MKELIKKIKQFIKTDIWFVNTDEMSWIKRLLVKILRVILLSSKDFQRDNCGVRASALTFYTVLSVVPVLALAFGIAQGFGLSNLLENLLWK